MRITYSREADALAIELVPDGTSHRTKKLDEFTRLDYDATGRLITIEILDASAICSPDELARFETPDVDLSLAEAAKESGLARDTLRVMLNTGRLRGRKRGRDWVVTRADLYNYLESRAPAGRPAKRKKARRGAVADMLEHLKGKANTGPGVALGAGATVGSPKPRRAKSV